MWNPSRKIPEILRLTVKGTYLTPRRVLLGSKSRVGTIIDLEKGEKLDHPHTPETKPTRGTSRRSTEEESCIHRRERWSNPGNVYTHPMVDRGQTGGCGDTVDRCFDGCGVQQTGDKPMVAFTRYLGDDLDTRALHPSQRKMTKNNKWKSDRWLQVLGVRT